MIGTIRLPDAAPMRGATIQPSHPLARGLMVCLPGIEGTGGTVPELSKRGSTATFVNDTSWTPGREGNGWAFGFDGAGDRIDVDARQEHFLSGSDEVSFAAWVRNDENTSTKQYLYRRRDDSGDDGFDRLVFYIQFKRLKIETNGNSTDEGSSAHYTDTVMGVGEWHHVYFEIGTDGNMAVYLDGVLESLNDSTTTNSSYNNLEELLEFGRDLNGAMDSICVWNRRLSQQEIWQHQWNFLELLYPRRFTAIFPIASSGSTAAYPSSCSNNTDVGAEAWVNPANVGADDGSYATVDLTSVNPSYYLDCRFSGLSVPAGATITDIQFDVQRKGTTNFGSIQDNSVKYIQSGAIAGNELADTGVDWATTEETKTYSGLAGLTWSASDFGANFGIGISALASGSAFNPDTASIDTVLCTVSYTIPVGTSVFAFDAFAFAEMAATPNVEVYSTDTLTLTDAVIAGLLKTVMDVLVLGDQIPFLEAVLPAVDSFVMTEADTPELTADPKTVQDGLMFSDSVIAGLLKAVTDTLTLTDAISVAQPDTVLAPCAPTLKGADDRIVTLTAANGIVTLTGAQDTMVTLKRIC